MTSAAWLDQRILEVAREISSRTTSDLTLKAELEIFQDQISSDLTLLDVVRSLNKIYLKEGYFASRQRVWCWSGCLPYSKEILVVEKGQYPFSPFKWFY